MKFFEKKVEKNEDKQNVDTSSLESEFLSWIDWTGDKNVTLRAYEVLKELYDERKSYIENHNRAKDFERKLETYKISATQVAKIVGCDRVTLVSTSTYSDGFNRYLKSLNEELESKKTAKLSTKRKEKQKTKLKKGAVEDRQTDKALLKNVEQQVQRALDLLDPEVRELLTIGDRDNRGSVSKIK